MGTVERSLVGNVALITGSTRRNGKAIATALARAGARVMITGSTSLEAAQGVADAIEAEHGLGCAAAAIADIRDGAAVDRLIASTIGAFGGLDILVNNAGIRGDAAIEEMSVEQWRSIIATTLDGAFLCARAAIPYLRKSGHGRIVNIGGVSAHVGGAHHLAQSTAKAGIVGLTRALASELGPSGITVNCVAPGPILSTDDPPERRARLSTLLRIDDIPLRRMGTNDELADAIVSLCTHAWGFVTGQTIHVNGGIYFG
jgi:3-oxoacyl-[acyl-carrier protein] reductase